MPKLVAGMPKGIRERNGKFQWDCTVQGKRKTGTANTLAQAVKDRAKALQGLMQGEGETEATYTLGQAYELALAERWQGTPGEGTAVKNMRSVIEYFGADRDVNEIDEDALDKFKAWCRQQGNVSATINRKTSALSVVLKFAYTRRKLKRLPLISRLTESNTHERYVTDSEERLMLDVMLQWGKTEQAYAMIVLLDTGMRTGEMLSLRKNDIDFDKKVLNIWKQNTKTKRSRTIPLTRRCIDALQKMMIIRLADTLEENYRLFPYDRYWLHYTFEKVKEHIGLQDEEAFTPHTLRHTYCSRLAQAGVPLQRIAMLAGHTAIKTTMRYAHLIPNDLDGIAELLENRTVDRHSKAV